MVALKSGPLVAEDYIDAENSVDTERHPLL